MNNIIPGLYLGSQGASQDRESLKKLNISHILIVGDLLLKFFPQDFTYQQVMVRDVWESNLISHFHSCTNFINEGLKSGGILVHCAAGISRSSTIVIAYLMETNKWSFDVAHSFVKEKRKCSDNGFRQQLQLFEKLKFEIQPSNPEVTVLMDKLKGTRQSMIFMDLDDKKPVLTPVRTSSCSVM